MKTTTTMLVGSLAILVLSLGAALPAADLSDLATIQNLRSHRASSHDPTGGNNDNIPSFAPGATHVLLDTDGPGRVGHLWFTVSAFRGHDTVLRDLVLRIYWEHSPVPSVEVPLGDFFALGHGKTYRVASLPVAVGYDPKALNCYWPMPFYKHARIEIQNTGRQSIRRIYYNVDYQLGEIPPDQGLFHAEFRRERSLGPQPRDGNTTGKDNYVLMETTGRGQYVGCALFVDAQPGGWWGEGDEMIFLDGARTPTIIGTGSEDYFCDAWGFDQAYSYPFYGVPLLEKQPDGHQLTTAYRWHVPDPVCFSKHIRVTIEHTYAEGVKNDYSSVAYWYQDRPIEKRRPLPLGEANHPRRPPAGPPPSSFTIAGTQLEPALGTAGVPARAITAGAGQGFFGRGYLEVRPTDGPVRIPITVGRDGTYEVTVRPVGHLIQPGLTLALVGQPPRTPAPHDGRQAATPQVNLGAAASKDKTLTLLLDGNPVIGLDLIRVRRIDEDAKKP